MESQKGMFVGLVLDKGPVECLSGAVTYMSGQVVEL